MKLTGNIVTNETCFFGELTWEGQHITKITRLDDFRQGESWILAGFIDLHFHGMGNYGTDNAEEVEHIPAFAVAKGITGVCPALASSTHDQTITWLKTCRGYYEHQPEGSRFMGVHLEGPWLSLKFKGGMLESNVRNPSMEEAKSFLEAGGGCIKLVTLAPEQPNGLEVTRYLVENGVTVSCGHTECAPEFLQTAVDAGVSQMCHLFDAYDVPDAPEGVRHPALTDMALINDGLMKEVIMDGLHVPQELVILARRAAGADHLVAITDAMQGAGLPYGRFLDTGRWYVIREGELARLEDNDDIVGSSLTQNRAFFNMTTRFGFTPVEASKALSANPAKQLKQTNTGILKEGYDADIAVLASDSLTVQACYVLGQLKYSSQAK